MDNVISLNSKRKAPPISRVINWVLSHDKVIVIGTSHVEHRMKELEAWFPDAKLEVVELGIKISNGG